MIVCIVDHDSSLIQLGMNAFEKKQLFKRWIVGELEEWPLAIPISELKNAFFNNIITHPNECWEWTGTKTSLNYSLLSWNGIQEYAHRISFRLFRGPCIRPFEVATNCTTARCCNPFHLELRMPHKNRQKKAQ